MSKEAQGPLRRIGQTIGGWLGNAGGGEESGSGGEDPEPASPEPAADLGTLERKRVEHVMVPRSDIKAVDIDSSADEIMQAFRACKHSRLPVYRETLDSPIGFLHLKDLALNPGWQEPNGPVPPARQHLRDPLLVPDSMSAAVLLREMQAKRIHIALVIDEFGGVDGLVTIEDLVEELVGEIEDEHDPQATQGWEQTAPGVFRCSARARIDDLEQATGTRLRPADQEEKADTIGGLVVVLTGRVPQRGEVIAHPDGHEFEILGADPHRIRSLKLSVRQPDPDADAA